MLAVFFGRRDIFLEKDFWPEFFFLAGRGVLAGGGFGQRGVLARGGFCPRPTTPVSFKCLREKDVSYGAFLSITLLNVTIC